MDLTGGGPPTKFKRRLSTALASDYLELSQTQPTKEEEDAEEKETEGLTLQSVYTELKVAQEALGRQLGGHESRLGQLEQATLPLQIVLTPFQCSTVEFWHCYEILSNTEEMQQMAEALEVGGVLDHFQEKVIMLSSCSSKTHSCMQKIRSISNAYGLTLFIAPAMHVSTKSLRRVTKLLTKSLVTVYANANMPMEKPYLQVREPVSTIKPNWSISSTTPSRQEQRLDPITIAKGEVVKIGEGNETYMQITLSEETMWDNEKWSLAAWKALLDTKELTTLPSYEYMVRVTWSTEPLTPLEVKTQEKGGKGGDKGSDTTPSSSPNAGKAGGKKGSQGQGKGKGKGKDKSYNKIPGIKGKGKSKSKDKSYSWWQDH